MSVPETPRAHRMYSALFREMGEPRVPPPPPHGVPDHRPAIEGRGDGMVDAARLKGVRPRARGTARATSRSARWPGIPTAGGSGENGAGGGREIQTDQGVISQRVVMERAPSRNFLNNFMGLRSCRRCLAPIRTPWSDADVLTPRRAPVATVSSIRETTERGRRVANSGDVAGVYGTFQ